MSNFIKANIRTIIFIIVVTIIVAAIFLYRYIKLNVGTYSPSTEVPKYEIKKYDANEYTVVNIKKEIVYRSYYKDYIDLMLNDPVTAFNKLTTNSKENLFSNDYNKFLDYTKSLNKSVLLSADISRFSDDNKKIVVIDTTDSSYIFYENGVWNYTVDLMGTIN